MLRIVVRYLALVLLVESSLSFRERERESETKTEFKHKYSHYCLKLDVQTRSGIDDWRRSTTNRLSTCISWNTAILYKLPSLPGSPGGGRCRGSRWVCRACLCLWRIGLRVGIVAGQAAMRASYAVRDGQVRLGFGKVTAVSISCRSRSRRRLRALLSAHCAYTLLYELYLQAVRSLSILFI